jgi:hypothetical protein
MRTWKQGEEYVRMTDLSPVFAGLQGVMLPYAEHLVRIVDGKG